MASVIDYNETNLTNNTNSILYVYQLDTSLFLLITICSVIGLVFNILSIIRYCRRPSLRTHFTYVFHFVLIYCLLASLFINPSLLIGYYGYAFTNYQIYCKCYGVMGSFMYVGIAYSLLYAGIERNYLTFRQNGQLTLIRQFLPMSIIFTLAFATSAAFYLIPKCPYVPCIACTAFNSELLIFWQAYSFFIPFVSLILSTIILLIHVNSRRERVRHQRLSNHFRPSKQITIQLCIYVLWSFVYYCPPATYNLFVAIDPKRYSSPIMKSIATIIGVLGIQVYPILTYIMFWGYGQHRNNQRRVQPK